MCFEQFLASVLLCCTAVFSTVQINTLKKMPAIAFSTATFRIVQNIFHLLSFSYGDDDSVWGWGGSGVGRGGGSGDDGGCVYFFQ